MDKPIHPDPEFVKTQLKRPIKPGQSDIPDNIYIPGKSNRSETLISEPLTKNEQAAVNLVQLQKYKEYRSRDGETMLANGMVIEDLPTDYNSWAYQDWKDKPENKVDPKEALSYFQGDEFKKNGYDSEKNLYKTRTIRTDSRDIANRYLQYASPYYSQSRVTKATLRGDGKNMTLQEEGYKELHEIIDNPDVIKRFEKAWAEKSSSSPANQLKKEAAKIGYSAARSLANVEQGSNTNNTAPTPQYASGMTTNKGNIQTR